MADHTNLREYIELKNLAYYAYDFYEKSSAPKAQEFLKDLGYTNITCDLYQNMSHEILNEKEVCFICFDNRNRFGYLLARSGIRFRGRRIRYAPRHVRLYRNGIGLGHYNQRRKRDLYHNA